VASTYIRKVSTTEHVVQFYEADAFLMDAVSEFIASGLNEADICIALATQPHIDDIEDRLRAFGLDVAAAHAHGQYIPLDATTVLAQLTGEGSAGLSRFYELVGDIVARAATGKRRVRVFGELVALLWADGKRAQALELEEIWNDLGRIHTFSLYCAYPLHGFAGEAYEADFSKICARHSRVIPAESYTSLASPDERLRAVSLLQQRANSLTAERAELDRRRDDFISMASHEFRMPLTSLNGFLELLQWRPAIYSDEKARHYLARMNTQVQKLNRLITNLLDNSMLREDRFACRAERFELNALLQTCVQNLQDISPTHLVQFEGLARVEVSGDHERVGQVLLNLLDNAIKYSPQAKRVLVRVTKKEGMVIVSVQDFGIGIAAEHLHKIFERFYQVSALPEQANAGPGIGLYISGEIIKRHGGSLWVESKRGKGSTFYFSLPCIEEG
jgi:signal transduction histidine kinase